LALLAAGGVQAKQEQRSDANGPDISGTWVRYPDDWYGPDPDHPPLPGGPFDLKEPYATQYAALKKKEAAADAAGTPLATASSKCLPEGMPTIMGAIYPIQIVQTQGQVIVLAEFLSQVRRIWLDDKMPALEDISPAYNGYSVGKWEGDTLVIRTRGVRDDVTFYDLPHGKDMVITERIRHSAPDRLVDEVTIEDPQTLDKPYRFTFEYKKSDYKIQEFICDNNMLKIDDEGGTGLNVDAISQ
jgi:hypothetical protein